MQWMNKVDENKIKQLDSTYFCSLVDLVESFKLKPEEELQLLIGTISHLFSVSISTLLNSTKGIPPVSFLDALMEKARETIDTRLHIIPSTTH